MINLRDEIIKSLPIPDFLTWYTDNWSGSSWLMWAEEALEMEKEGVVKIERGRVELINKTRQTKKEACEKALSQKWS